MIKYKGTYIPDCPNHCFEHLVDDTIAQNTVQGVEPMLIDQNRTYCGYDARKYIPKMNRHSLSCNGWGTHTHWRFCPLCGAGLMEGGKQRNA